MKKMKKGFSLVEMVIAILIIGILSLPLLAYFSGAAINSSRGSRIQVGEMAAQSVIEEVNSYDTYDQLSYAVNNAVSGCAFTADTSAPSDGRDYYLRDISADGFDLTAKVMIDFEYESPDDLEYNQYKVPDLKALYTDQNVVAAEEDESVLAVNEFFYNHEGKTSKADIRGDMTRTGEISISTNASDPNLYDVSVRYEYNYKTDAPISFTVVKTEIPKENFRNLYFLYELLSDSAGPDEEMTVNFSSDIPTEEAKEMSIYFICQNPDGFDFPPNYQIHIGAAAGSAPYAKYFASADKAGVDIPITGVGGHSFYIEGEAKNRIANITVDIYHRDETVFTEDTRILRMESAK